MRLNWFFRFFSRRTRRAASRDAVGTDILQASGAAEFCVLFFHFLKLPPHFFGEKLLFLSKRGFFFADFSKGFVFASTRAS